VLVATAATLGRANSQASLQTIGQVANALVPFLGTSVGHFAFALGTIGAAMVAAIVVSLAFAWGFGEVTSHKHSLEYHPLEAPWFYGVFTVAVVGGAIAVGLSPDLVALNIGVEVMNALMLPIVLGFLVILAFRALPPEHRLRGLYGVVVVVVSVLTAALGVYGGIAGAIFS
jgi:Mn2+/Fe2+ NRAMP family transporter